MRPILPLLLATLVLPGATPLPDLVVRRDGFERDGETIAFVVENRGTAPSPASEVELWDRPPLMGPTGTSSPYPFAWNRNQIWLRQEPVGSDTVAIDIELGSDRDQGKVSGAAWLANGGEFYVAGASPGVRYDPSTSVVTWDGASMGDANRIRLRVPIDSGRRPAVILRKDDFPDRSVLIHAAHTATLNTRHGIVIDSPDRPLAGRRRVSVPALEPGERVRLEADFPGGVLGETFAIVDPGRQIVEYYEGNNTSSIRDDASTRTLGALHIHSSFSEGAGSVDFQVGMAARTGYDLIWWTEHDWRVDCWEHTAAIDFEEDSADRIEGRSPDSLSIVALVDEDVRSGESALRIAVPPGEAGTAVARLIPDRNRIAYVLAADVTVELDVLARNLDTDDSFRIVVELSRFDGGFRDLVYDFRMPGLESDATPASGHFVRRLSRDLPSGSWVRVSLPLSRDAAHAWENGLDDSITGIEFRAVSGGSGVDLRLDGMKVAHHDCGDALRYIQEEWMDAYPNVAHAFGEEISVHQPHMNQYGGRRGVVDYAAAWEETYVDATIEQIHTRGGIVSWCHPFGVIQSGKVRRRHGAAFRDSLITQEFGGTDILEVGYRARTGASLQEYLEFWDQAGVRGVRITGIGVNDSHQRKWGPWENNFGTWIDAEAGDLDALQRALRQGRVFFGDPLAFRGRVSIQSEGAGPGEEVSGASPRTITLAVEGAPEKSRMILVIDGKRDREWPVEGGSGSWTVDIPAGTVRLVRGEVRGLEGRPLAFTNPVYFRSDD